MCMYAIRYGNLNLTRNIKTNYINSSFPEGVSTLYAIRYENLNLNLNMITAISLAAADNIATSPLPPEWETSF